MNRVHKLIDIGIGWIGTGMRWVDIGIGCIDTGMGWIDTGMGLIDTGMGWIDIGPFLFPFTPWWINRRMGRLDTGLVWVGIGMGWKQIFIRMHNKNTCHCFMLLMVYNMWFNMK